MYWATIEFLDSNELQIGMKHCYIKDKTDIFFHCLKPIHFMIRLHKEGLYFRICLVYFTSTIGFYMVSIYHLSDELFFCKIWEEGNGGGGQTYCFSNKQCNLFLGLYESCSKLSLQRWNTVNVTHISEWKSTNWYLVQLTYWNK